MNAAFLHIAIEARAGGPLLPLKCGSWQALSACAKRNNRL